MTDMTPAPISVERLREVIAFLLGEGELDNRWFGDGSAPLVAGKYRAPYWWRTQLRETTDSLLHQLAEREAEVYLLRSWLCDCFVNAGADTDGSTDVRALSERAVQAVIDLRRDYDENEDWKGRACAAERAREEAISIMRTHTRQRRGFVREVVIMDAAAVDAFLAASGGGRED